MSAIGAGAAAGAPFDLALDDLESENDAAVADRHGHVDVVFGAQSAARTAGLGFVPLLRERVDLLVSRRSYFEPPVQALLDFCRSPVFADYARALDILKSVRNHIKAREIVSGDKIAKVSIVGVGMRSHAGVAAQMFKALAAENVNIKVITTSEIKISVLIDRKYMELAVQALHDAFGLEKAA